MSDIFVGAVMSSLISLFLFEAPVSAEPPREDATPAVTTVAAQPVAESPTLPPLPTPDPLPPLPTAAPTQVTETPLPPAPSADAMPRPEDFDIPVANQRCIAMMEGFPSDSLASRYQFYRLIQDLSRDVTPEVALAIQSYGSSDIPADAPVMDTIEQITNPVLRQAMPEATVAQMGHLIGFGTECADFIDGQVTGLAAADPSLDDPAFNLAIGQDALFMRQILLDSLYRLGADTDPQHGGVIARYQRGLVTLRDDMEFAAFDAELAELEALALGDLSERLDTANASVNDGLYEDSTTSAVRLAKDMSDAARRESQQQMARILIDILGSY